MSQSYSVINGTFVPAADAVVSLSDLAIQRGYGIFDYFRTSNNIPVFLEDHLNRFYHSAEIMHLTPEISREQLREQIMELISRNNIPESGIRLTLTGGYSPSGYLPASPNLLITQTPFQFNEADVEKGIRLITSNYQRQHAAVKTIDYIHAIYLQPEMNAKKADDILYHHNGALRECPRANFFIVTAKDEVLTASEDILHGITRKKILAFEDMHVKAAAITLDDLANAKEAFITSTTKVVLPVIAVDGQAIGNGQPGKLTREIYGRLLACRNKV